MPEIKLGYVFNSDKLLRTALTHSSYANEKGLGRIGCNERLEFLGDSLLGFIVAEYLYKNYSDKPEGEMTRLRAELVCEQSLVRVAQNLNLGQSLNLGRGEEQCGGRERPSILADAVEAILAAIYLDGGKEAATRFVLDNLLLKYDNSVNTDSKTALQELTQRDGKGSPTYKHVGDTGPDHEKLFYAEVWVNGQLCGEGCGKSKKEAEQAAAGKALQLLKT